MMNFQMTITHPSGDINKLNGYMSLDSGVGGERLGLEIRTWELSAHG